MWDVTTGLIALGAGFLLLALLAAVTLKG